MNKQVLHITNGSVLTDLLNELDYSGEKLTWQEMLCEGPTLRNIDSKEFIDLRKKFFNDFYDVELDVDEIKFELKKLDNTENYSEIVLWFEYDLFCHINMLAVINLIQQKKINLPIYLVCSGRITGGKSLKGLSELSSEQLLSHFDNKVLLNQEDMDLAATVWGIYCGIDHNLLKPFIVKSSSFKYLNSCLKAHLKRFPDSVDGLAILERNILEIVAKYNITSKHHLLGYALSYQGYYGYGDIQLIRIIEKLSVFYNVTEEGLTLNRKGHEVLLGHHNYAFEIDDNMVFGGVNKFDFQFNKKLNKLIKTIINAH